MGGSGGSSRSCSGGGGRSRGRSRGSSVRAFVIAASSSTTVNVRRRNFVRWYEAKAPVSQAPLLRTASTHADLTPDHGETVTVGLFASNVYPLFGNSLNSYVPAVVGIVTVHVKLVTPFPM